MGCAKKYLDDISKAPQFTKKEEWLLWDRMRDGKEARRQLIESQLRGVITLVAKWSRVAEQKGIPFEDLVQQANSTLVMVVDEKFDADRGRLYSVLKQYVRNGMNALVGSDDRLVRKPAYYMEGRADGRSSRTFQEQADATDKPVVSLGESREALDIDVRGPETNPSVDLDADGHLEWLRNKVFTRVALLLGQGVSLRDILLFLDFVWINNGTSTAKLSEKYGVSVKHIRGIIRRVRGKLKEKGNEI